MTPATLTVSSGAWPWVALALAVVLLPLAWLALAPAGRRSRTLAVGFAFRILGVGLLLLCLIDPTRITPHASSGANLFAVVADNSMGLAIRDPGASQSRGEQLRERLVAAGDAWLGRLADDFQLRAYTFDRDLRRVRDFGRLDFSGDRSDLGAALARVRERHAGQPLAGVLLFTDGIATDLASATPDLASLPPVYPVVVGEPGVRDIRIDSVAVRQTAFDDAPVTVQATVAGELAGARDVVVSLMPFARDDGLAPGEVPEPATVRLGSDGSVGTSFSWRPSGSGVQFYEVRAVAQGAEAGLEQATELNDRRVIMIDRGRAAYRILYVGGRPGWEFKFLNRALVDDPQLRMSGLLRIARREPKFEFKGRAGESSNPMFRGFTDAGEEAPRYDQPVLVRVNARDDHELRGGFPKTAEELFAYDAVILHAVEAAFFTLEQQSLLRRFVSDRGGGLLMLGGADSFESGDYAGSPLGAVLPLYLDRRSGEWPRGALRWSLTREGWVEPWVRVRENERDERARLLALPPLFVAHGLEQARPGATVLAQVEDEDGRVFPALVYQPFGLGRVISLTTGDVWRWGLHDETSAADLARFWRQINRRLLTDVPEPVSLVVESDPEGGARLRVTARDRAFRPLDAARVSVTIRRIHLSDEPAPAGGRARFESVTLPAEPMDELPGGFAARFAGRDAGAYVAEAEVTTPAGELVGRARSGWVVDNAGEEFRSVNPNRALLASIAQATGGEIVGWDQLDRFVAGLPARAAPIQELRAAPVWHSPWMLLAVLGCLGAEWFWRRWRGLP